MDKIKSWITRNKSNITKFFVFVITTVCIVYLFPKRGKFKYTYSKGKPWQYENLYAEFDFAILKSEEDLKSEKNEIRSKVIPIFEYDTLTVQNAYKEVEENFEDVFQSDLSPKKQKQLKSDIVATLNRVYDKGYFNKKYNYKDNKLVYIKKGKEVKGLSYGSLFDKEQISVEIKERVSTKDSATRDKLTFLLFRVLKPNVSINEELTNKALDEELSKVLTTKGSVKKNSRIIAKGEEVSDYTFQVLKSLQDEYEAKIWSENNRNWIVFGYVVLVGMAILMLFLFIHKYRYEVFVDNKKVIFIVFNILLMILITTIVVKIDPNYVYIVPIAILPLVVKAFFDSRMGLFTHVITVLILSFIVPNSDEYMFLQIITGIVTILTSSELYKRANLFLSVGKITFVYFISYMAFHTIKEGGLFEDGSSIEEKIKVFQPLLWFVLCGFATLMVHPLIYGFEKIFGLVSDVSLLELSDTNSALLKKLSNEAPGTFYHSLNVANIAEACANEIGANAMLTRVGALYHDIGKMAKPMYFTENQNTGINPHDRLSPEESAKIIVDHVSNGVEIAQRNNLPDRVIDFIRTHHGTSTVYYFYKKAQEENPDISIEKFQYKGPTPFTKEMAILMMSDSVEAASKSLKQHTASLINDFVEKIINKQMNNGQFLEADITFKEIQRIKKVMKQKLANIYHVRVEYPK